VRVFVDCTPLLLRSAGVKTYLYHLFAALRQLRGDQVRSFPPFRGLAELDHQRSAVRGFPSKAAIGLAVLANRIDLPVLDLFARGADLFHTSNIVRNPPRRSRLTATIHDLTCWIMPELHTAANVAADRDFADRVLRRADKLVAVSEATRADAVRHLGLDPDRIHAIHHGVDEAFFTAPPGRRAKPYVLALGTLEPRKNLVRLLDAWAMLRPSIREEHELVIAGPPGWESAATMERIRREATYIGYVADGALPSLVAGATVFAYPSLYEGFGIPLAQAMACGVACVTSNVSSMPEVAGGAAALVDPRSVAEIASALDRLLTSPSERARMGAAGRVRAAERFRWERCARETWSVFERACG
jgi:glycosyltransferase involved in cell wall biosynthesis